MANMARISDGRFELVLATYCLLTHSMDISSFFDFKSSQLSSIADSFPSTSASITSFITKPSGRAIVDISPKSSSSLYESLSHSKTTKLIEEISRNQILCQFQPWFCESLYSSLIFKTLSSVDFSTLPSFVSPNFCLMLSTSSTSPLLLKYCRNCWALLHRSENFWISLINVKQLLQMEDSVIFNC